MSPKWINMPLVDTTIDYNTYKVAGLLSSMDLQLFIAVSGSNNYR